MPKSRSAEDMDVVILNESDPTVPEKSLRELPDKLPIKLPSQLDHLATKHISMIASRAKSVERKSKKMKSSHE